MSETRVRACVLLFVFCCVLAATGSQDSEDTQRQQHLNFPVLSWCSAAESRPLLAQDSNHTDVTNSSLFGLPASCQNNPTALNSSWKLTPHPARLSSHAKKMHRPSVCFLNRLGASQCLHQQQSRSFPRKGN